MIHEYIIEGEPIAQARHRHFNNGKFIRTYDPCSKSKEKVAHMLESQKRTEIQLDEEISVTLTFCHQTPKSATKSTKCASNWHLPKLSKPDIDNLIKFVLDAANGVLWPDDAQIATITARKQYSKNPFTKISVMVEKNLLNKETIRQVINVLEPDQLHDLIMDMKNLCDLYEAAGGKQCITRTKIPDLEKFLLSFHDFCQSWLKDITQVTKKPKKPPFKNGKPLS